MNRAVPSDLTQERCVLRELVEMEERRRDRAMLGSPLRAETDRVLRSYRAQYAAVCERIYRVRGGGA